MVQNINELKNQIVQKNLILNSIEQDDSFDEKSIRKEKVELDGLLYKYYKLLKSKNIKA